MLDMLRSMGICRGHIVDSKKASDVAILRCDWMSNFAKQAWRLQPCSVSVTPRRRGGGSCNAVP